MSLCARLSMSWLTDHLDLNLHDLYSHRWLVPMGDFVTSHSSIMSDLVVPEPNMEMTNLQHHCLVMPMEILQTFSQLLVLLTQSLTSTSASSLFRSSDDMWLLPQGVPIGGCALPPSSDYNMQMDSCCKALCIHVWSSRELLQLVPLDIGGRPRLKPSHFRFMDVVMLDVGGVLGAG